MDIKKLMQDMHNASSVEEKKAIEEKIKQEFSSLTDSEKEDVRACFLDSLDNKLKEADNTLKKVDISVELAEISKYISLSQIAKDYFGKSKEWLYQRIKGYNVNGKPAQFTEEEKKKLSEALEHISRRILETSLKIA